MSLKLKQKMGLNMFDLLKGFIIILVVVRHSIGDLGFPDTLAGKIIFSVLMPSLFLVSGYWLNKRDMKTGLSSSVRSLLIPCLIVIAIIVGVGAVHRAFTHNMQNWVDLYLVPSLLIISTGGKITPLWFMFALFIAWCLYYAAVNTLSEKAQMAAACCSAVIGGLTMPLMLPFQISQGLIAFFYVYAGYQMKKRKLLQKPLPALVVLALLAVWTAGFLFGSMELSDYRVHNFLLSVPGGLCGAYLLVRLFLCLNALQWKILDPIRWVGRYSMWILCIHAVEAAIFPWKILFPSIASGSPFGMMLRFVLRWILIVAVCQGMMWWKTRALTRSRVG